MRLRFPGTRSRLRRDAATWLARLRGAPSDDDRAAFERWYEADPTHRIAFDRVTQNYGKAAALRHSHLAKRRSLDRVVPAPAPQARYGLVAAGVAVLVVAGTAGIVGRSGFSPFQPIYALMLSTGSDIRETHLDDGSKVTLDAATSLRVELGRSERHAKLEKGRIRLTVVREERPFIVESGQLLTTIHEGVVEADVRGGVAKIDVIAGSATWQELQPGTQAPTTVGTIAQGQQRIEGARATTPSHVGLRSGWLTGMLEFDATPLSQVAADANRYAPTRPIVIDRAIAGLRVTGAFKAGDTPALARSLSAAFGLELVSELSGELRLRPAKSKTMMKYRRPDSASTSDH